ncbi:hypothetical protein IWQ57_005741 [Coemansia nantahalensis]|uniref:Uncharacterized protein n=1 Tax=Coemansia nantahalensis TaxID=2789366 RepID=A0ACC1JLU9_9FUNG|nr:hypothetical protein IWQ57_005741 [Coemansia nantahalensis]
MKLAAVLALSAVAVAQSATPLTVFEQCIQKKCPNNPTDVNCQAACQGNPNPNASMISQVYDCYEQCSKPGVADVAACREKCNLIYNPEGVIITDHLVPEGVTPTAIALPTADQSDDDDDTKPSKSAPGSSKSSKSGNSASGASGNSDDSDKSRSSGAAALKVSLGAAALAVASLAFLA